MLQHPPALQRPFPAPLPLFKAGERAKLKVIAEIKRASPSEGLIRQDFRPIEHAKDYIANGAAALSVLTDQLFFQGDLQLIPSIRPASSVPILRKDFIIDRLQIDQSYQAGADGILLIVAILTKQELTALYQHARELGLFVLVEVHDLQELELALEAEVEIIGINNRDLKTFQVRLENSLELAERIPASLYKVSESGIFAQEHMRIMQKAGFDAVLVGSHFMRAASPGQSLQQLLQF